MNPSNKSSKKKVKKEQEPATDSAESTADAVMEMQDANNFSLEFKPVEAIEEVPFKEETSDTASPNGNDFTFGEYPEVESSKSVKLSGYGLSQQNSQENISTSHDIKCEEDTELYNLIFLNKRIARYARSYNIQRTHRYRGRINDLFILFGNIPIYLHNRDGIRKMMRDSKYYSGGDFIGYINYLDHQTSVKSILNIVFNRSYFKTKEVQYLNDHAMCAQWVLNYCNKMDNTFLREKRLELFEKKLTLS